MALMSIDPNVQVAMVSVIATTITTLGVVAVAVINNKKERGNSASAGVDAGLGLDERAALTKVFTLLKEKEELINEVKDLKSQIARLLEK